MVSGPDIFCQPSGNIVQMVTLLVSGGSQQYTWSTGAEGNVANVLPTETTTYTVTSEIAPNCIATGSITIEYLMTEVSNVQIYTCGSQNTSAEYEGNFYQIGEHFVYMGEASNGCDSYTQLTVSPFVVNIDFIDGTLVASEFENAVYYWYECGNEVSLQVGSSNTFTPTFSGLYNVYVETDICGTDNIDCVEIVVGVKELESFNFQLSPNPATSEFRLSNLPLNAAVQIFDTAGKMVFASKSISSNMTIGTEHLEPGLYIVQVQNDGGNFASEKLIISE
ncbi:MAG: T9SS type A sorting domain-containing protein [Flavobacteriales bacterium]